MPCCELKHGPVDREVKRAPLALTQIDQTGVFEGYASVFGVVDLGRDVVLRGAFAQTLAQRPAADVKMLWQHNSAEPIGTWLSINEDARGLKVRGKLNLAVARAREVLSLMRDGAVDGLSIGFHARKSTKNARTGIRSLCEIDLWEISIVTFPMLPQARVTAVKRFIDAAQWRAQLARLRWQISATGLEAKFVSARKDLADAGAPPDAAAPGDGQTPGAGSWQNQPRAPSGTPEGGQWVSGGGGGSGGGESSPTVQEINASSENVGVQLVSNISCDDLFSSDLEICRFIGNVTEDKWLATECAAAALKRFDDCLNGVPLSSLLPKW